MQALVTTDNEVDTSTAISINGEEVESCPCTLGVSRWEFIQCKTLRNSYKVMHQAAVKRENVLKKKLESAEAEIKLLKQKLFGKSSEKYNPSEKQSSMLTTNRSRGQQKGSQGHGRKKQPHLPIIEEFVEIPEPEKVCSCCQLPYAQINSTEDSEVMEIEVKGYIRKIRRKKYRQVCNCPESSCIVTAPVAPRLFPKSTIGLSIWVDILVRKYDEYCPLNRLLTSLGKLGISMAQGTVTGGLKRLLPIFQPIADAIKQHSQEEKHWHADETRWEVFEPVEGKSTHRWYLWIFGGKEAVTYLIEPTRGYVVVADFFKDVDEGVLSCDRYAVYIKLSKETGVLLALCWAHLRRDFLDIMKAYPELESWAMVWVEDIRTLYQLNKERRKLNRTTRAYQTAHQALSNKLSNMKTKLENQLNDPTFANDSKRVLTSFKRYWHEYTIFLGYPDVPMDNNKGERIIRPATIARKNYYGSGSVWSASLTAGLFSIFATLKLWSLNPRSWLLAYLRACENNQGKVPDDLTPFLPWKMSPEKMSQLSRPPDHG